MFQVPSDWVVTDSDPNVLSLECPEEYRDITDNDIVVWLDPLDGTKEYSQVKKFFKISQFNYKSKHFRVL